MQSILSLGIPGYRDTPVPNTFIRQDHASPHLAILLPGYGYRATMPAVYHPERLLIRQGADILRLEYAYDQQADFRGLPEDERDLWFFADVEAARDIGRAQGSYEQVTLVGKSMGTLAMGHLLSTGTWLEQVRCVWVTPLLRDDRLRAQIKQAKPRSLFVVGTADGHYDPAHLAEVEQATQGHSVVIKGANHSLEIGDSTAPSPSTLERVMRAMESFLGGAVS